VAAAIPPCQGRIAAMAPMHDRTILFTLGQPFTPKSVQTLNRHRRASAVSSGTACITARVDAKRHDEALPRAENPGRGFANALVLALPLWGLIGAVIWALV
jgi:hypothetical protein